MQKRLFALGACAAAFAALPAGAALRDFDGSFAVTKRSPNLPLPLISVAGSGTGQSSRSPSNQISGFTSVTGFTGTSTATTPIGVNTLEIDGIGDPTFFGTPVGMLGGPMPVFGELRSSLGSVLIMLNSGAVGLGLGGTQMLGTDTTIHFAPWTTGMATLMNVSPAPGETSVTTVTTGSDSRTASGMGMVQLVTPTLITADSGLIRFMFMSRLSLEFMPEPQRAVLFLAGSAVLLLLARHRRR